MVSSPFSECPGANAVKMSPVEFVKCPECGGQVEMWFDEHRSKCPDCGHAIVREKGATCIEWCPSARKCFGEESYARYHGLIKE